MSHVEKCRKEAEAATRKRLPFDDDVLLYLLKVAPVSEPQELLELLNDFCPDWNVEGRAHLASVLRDVGTEETDTGSTNVPPVMSVPSFGGVESEPGRSAQQDEDADRMLAQMLQESEEAEAALNQGQPGQARRSKKQKKGFTPLNINYTVGRNAGTPAFGTAAPSSLADLLRTRRQQEQRAGDLQAENFGPPAARTNTPWAPVPQDNMTGMTWAERAQMAAERAPEPEPVQQAPPPQPQPTSATSMTLKLRTATGSEYKITADRSETIGDVKARMAKQHNTPVDSQRIFYLGRELTDSLQLRVSNIPEGQPLQLALRNVAEPPQQSWPQQPAQNIASTRDDRFMVRLRLPGGNVANLDGVADSSMVSAVKHRIQQEHGIRFDRVQLSFFGSVLADDWTLADSGIANSAIIDVTLLTPKAPGSSLPETIRQTPTPQGPQVAAARSEAKQPPPMGKKRSSGNQPDQLSSLQTTTHGRVLTEAEALELALAASRGEEVLAGSSGVALQGQSPTDDNEHSDDEAQGENVGDSTDFLIDVATKDDKMVALVAHAKRVASEFYPVDLISRVSKRSGLRLTFIVERCKKPKRVLGYMVYRFRTSILYLLQFAIAADQRNRGLTRHALKWMVQYGKKTNSELIVTCCRPSSVEVYQKLGFRRGDAKALDVADYWEENSADGLQCMEYRCRKANTKDVKITRPDFEPPPAFNASRQTTVASTSQLSRGELLRKLFVLLDADGDGRLDKQEMHVFAKQTGFEGGDEEWTSEFKALLASVNAPQDYVDLRLLTILVNDESDEGCYCTDDELKEMVTSLEADAKARQPMQPSQNKLPRPELIASVFNGFDRDCDGMLNQSEMLLFAKTTGFDASDQVWAEEYQLILSQYPETQRTRSMIALPVFEKLVNDDSDEGCYCSDADLQKMLSDLKEAGVPTANRSAQEPAVDARKQLVREVFDACDFDGDGLLNLEEMKRFAGFTGFDGDDASWEEEYRMLCNSYDGQKSSIDFALFSKLVDDESDDGCYCTDDELRDMLGKLQKMRPVNAAPTGQARTSNSHEGSGKEQEKPAVGARQGSASQALVEKLREPDRADSASYGNASKHGRSRVELIRAVFQACDADSDGRLNSKEMRVFAGFTGFEGSDEEWAEEYEMLRTQYASTSSDIDLPLFQQLVEDQSDDGCYCTDEELQQILDALPKQSAAAEVNQPAAVAMQPAAQKPTNAEAVSARQDVGHEDGNAKTMVDARQKLIRAAFEACDADGDGSLCATEMKKFAAFTGFDGNDEEWAAEYQVLCSQYAHSGTGIDYSLFLQLVEDESDEGCYCTDDELRDIAKALQSSRAVTNQAPPTTSGQLVTNSSGKTEATERLKLIHAVFKVLDVKRLGYLASAEMKRFAKFSGFDGSDQEWASEFKLLCTGKDGQARTVIDLPFFEALVEDESDEGCYLTDGELREAITSLQTPEAPTSSLQPEVTGHEESYKAERSGEEKQSGQPTDDGGSHMDLIRAVFKACDADGDGWLSGSEMLQFARFTGFEGSDEEWQEEYKMLCSQYKGTRSSIDLVFFQQLVEDESDDGCYCTDDELRKMLVDLKAQPQLRAGAPAQSAPSPQPTASAISGSSPGNSGVNADYATAAQAKPTQASLPSGVPRRRELIQEVFHACDSDRDGRLNSAEMRVFAAFTGFSGNDAEWQEEYDLLRAQYAGSRSDIDFVLFEQLVDDESDNGCYCTDEELAGLLAMLRTPSEPPRPPVATSTVREAAPTAASSRADLVHAVFRACDADGDGCLSCQEMRSFASRTGFEGSEAEWASEYGKLFLERGGNAARGVDINLFLQLLEDESDDGCYCTDDELRSMLHDLFSDVRARAEVQVNQAAATSTSATPQRTEQLWQLFKALDADGDGRLSAPEMRRFAGYIGFEGDDAAWREEFERLFADNSGDPAEGLGLPLFMRLVEDESEDGCYCSDEELGKMLDELKAEQQEVDALAGQFFVELDRNGSRTVTRADFQSFATLAGATLGKDLLPWAQHAWCNLATVAGTSGSASESYSDGPPASVDQDIFRRLISGAREALPPARLREVLMALREGGGAALSSPAMRPPPGLAPPSPAFGPSSSQVPQASKSEPWHGNAQDDEWQMSEETENVGEDWNAQGGQDLWKDFRGAASQGQKGAGTRRSHYTPAGKQSEPSAEPAQASWHAARDGAAADWWSGKDDEWNGKEDDWWASGDGNDWWWTQDSDQWSEAAPNQSQKGYRKGAGRGARNGKGNGKGNNTWWAKR